MGRQWGDLQEGNEPQHHGAACAHCPSMAVLQIRLLLPPVTSCHLLLSLAAHSWDDFGVSSLSAVCFLPGDPRLLPELLSNGQGCFWIKHTRGFVFSAPLFQVQLGCGVNPPCCAHGPLGSCRPPPRPGAAGAQHGQHLPHLLLRHGPLCPETAGPWAPGELPWERIPAGFA